MVPDRYGFPEGTLAGVLELLKRLHPYRLDFEIARQLNPDRNMDHDEVPARPT